MPREEIFLTSKLWNTHQPNVKQGLQKSLEALGTDYLDLYVSDPATLMSTLSLSASDDWEITFLTLKTSSFTGQSVWFP